MAQQVLSVSQINEYLRRIVDADHLLSSVAVRGEISNYKIYPSGHHYFTLKDENASIKCVMFRSSTVKLRFRPENGMQVIAVGKISVYPRDGAYQLYCNTIILDGAGDLNVAFEQLKKKLAAQGLFDAAHKKPLPVFPGVIGIVTSSAGAAVHDILRVLKKRYPIVSVRLFPVRVQGTEAPGEISAAIAYANKYHLADVLIVGRGGGSLEDLWAFNNETVANAIYASEIPVISAVGHEPDVTISDFVADVRAATPSNAAELAVPDQTALRQNMDGMTVAMAASFQRQMKMLKRQLQILSSSPALQSPQSYLEQRKKTLQLIKLRLVTCQKQSLNRHRQRYISSTAKLDALSPLRVLARGYAVVTIGTHILHNTSQAALGDTIRVQLSNGDLVAQVTDIKEKRNESNQ